MRATAVVVGAGHAGLAMSRCLAERSIDHVVLERGEVANSWKTERWDSLRLLTPNWQSRLPGYRYAGPDPHGYRTMPETVGYLEQYAAAISAPVRTHTAVTSVRPTEDGYAIQTSRGAWRCRAVVLASGACNIATDELNDRFVYRDTLIVLPAVGRSHARQVLFTGRVSRYRFMTVCVAWKSASIRRWICG